MRHGAPRKRRDAESGVSAIEFVFLTPVLFFLIFATVQFALFFFARHVAIASAQEGARVARAEAADPNYTNWNGDAKAESQVWISRLAPNLFDGTPTVNVATSTVNGVATVSVTVVGTVPSMIPGVSGLTVDETSSGPIEQFLPDN